MDFVSRPSTTRLSQSRERGTTLPVPPMCRAAEDEASDSDVETRSCESKLSRAAGEDSEAAAEAASVHRQRCITLVLFVFSLGNPVPRGQRRKTRDEQRV